MIVCHFCTFSVVVVLSVLFQCTASNYTFGIFNLLLEGESEDTKGVIRICNSKTDIQHNGQKKNDKGTNTYLQNITQKTRD